MDKNISSFFVMNLNENGQNVLVDRTDPNRSYIFDEHGNLIAQNQKIKVEETRMSNNEEPMDLEDTSADILNTPITSELADHSLVMMNDLDEVPTFEECLMPELDNPNLVNIDLSDENFIMQHMDIREPLNKLRKLLENRLDIDLTNYQFTLQETQVLEGHKNLVDQCVQGEGVVQVNTQVQPHLKRINIVDVLKPAEDYVDTQSETELKSVEGQENNDEKPGDKENKVIHQWQVDHNFKSALLRLKIPSDPEKWTVMHVRHWIQWAVRQFNLPNLKLSDWSMKGEQLFQIDIHRFQQIVPSDPGDVFWTHFELLRKMRVVAVIKKDKPKQKTKLTTQKKAPIEVNKAETQQFFTTVVCEPTLTPRGNTSGSGQVQLWQFLLELLTTRHYKPVISWLGQEGEFILIQPEMVAQLWGERKNKPAMNYEKLSRALRYYYDGDMICKVPKKRFVYKFVCDLKQLLGYSAIQLSNLVNFGNPNASTY